MSHELNELAEGVYSFADSRTDAWHQLGTQVGHTMTATEALEAAHLNGWNVRKIGLTATELTEHGVTTVEVPDRFATVYTNPVTGATQYLGVVGTHYTPIQNETNADLIDAVVDQSGAHFETAGSMRGGRDTFITMKLPDTMQVGGNDPVDLYLAALNSNDGSSAFRFLITPVRVVCKNTETAAIRSAKASFSIRHVAGSSRTIHEAREALGLTFKYVEAFQAEAEKMIAQSIADAEFERITAQVFGGGVATTKRQQTTLAEHVGGVMSIYRESPTMTDLKGTKWGAYNAITEYTDHFMKVRNTGNAPTVARAFRTLTSHPVRLIKEAAFAQLSA